MKKIFLIIDRNKFEAMSNLISVHLAMRNFVLFFIFLIYFKYNFILVFDHENSKYNLELYLKSENNSKNNYIHKFMVKHYSNFNSNSNSKIFSFYGQTPT